ncbi:MULTISPECIES: helix-turn-helix transcriptional regulator [unclassified Streptomyces]|uniref:helix-turn-helix transcriptional regulator n=1 Tax=unclassified Streptomyces TaxID=2593676 RepID=UPI0034556464
MDGADADPVALARLLELAVAALHETRPEQLWSLAFTELLDALDADLAVRKAEEWSPGEGTVRLWTPEGPAHHLLGPEQLDVIRTGYPFVDHYAAGHPLEPLTARATAGAHAWRHAAPAGHLRDALGSTDILGLPLPRPEKGAIHGCLLHRTGRRPFTPAHLAYARRAQPVIAAVEAHAAHLRAWRTTPGGPEAATVREERAAALGLTPREITVLALLAEARTATAIAQRLGISPRTVHRHLAHLYRKFGTRDRLATVLRARETGVL